MSTTHSDETLFSRACTHMNGARENRFLLLTAVAEIESGDTAHAAGYPCTERLLEDLLHIDRRDARQLVRHAAALVAQTSLSGDPLPPRAPATAAVTAAGQIGPAHVDVVLGALDRLTHLPAPILTEAEQTLADAATHLPPRALAKVADRLVATLDPDGVAPDDDADPVDELHLGTRPDGPLNGKFRFHAAADRELVREVLDALSAPAGPDDPRSLATRQAEAFLDLLAQAVSPTGIADPGPADAGPDHDGGDPTPRRPPIRALGRATLTVLMDFDWLREHTGHATLDSDHAISPAEARRLACDAGVVPMVLAGRSEPLDVGRLSYVVPDGMRRALNVRDGGCAFPGCTRRPGRCAAHHIRHWAEGGATTLDNVTLLCRYHHRIIHREHWRITMRDGRPWFVPPRFVDPNQTPRPGGRHPG